MAGISSLFNIGASGLFASQKALSVTAHNMANVNTQGYSKQEAVLSESTPQDGYPGQIGTGVQVTEIRRNVDAFINQQLLSSRQQYGQYDASQNALAEVQTLFGDSQDLGIGTGLNDLFNAFHDVATNPSDPTARTSLLQKAQALTDQFHQASTALGDQRQALDGEIGQTITNVNGLASQIAALNEKISQAESAGQQANDLRDQRQTLLNNLGELINVTPLEDSTGQVTVFIGKGQTLVDKSTAHQLTGVPVAANDGLLDVQYSEGGTPVSLSSVISSGRLKGLLDARDQTIPGLQTKLDSLAQQLVTEVNQQHQAGFGLDGSTGLDFFSATGTTAGTIAVALTDPRQIAASDNAGGVPGNNGNALAMAALQDKPLSALGGATLNEYYAATAAGIGSAAQQADSSFQAQKLLQDQLQSHWAEISGVSLDEELVNMMQYQRAFEASSRVITMSDQLMQTILNLKQ